MRTSWLWMALVLGLGACTDGEDYPEGSAGQGGAAGGGGSAGAAINEDVVDAPLVLDCDPIVPQHCGYPFPNNTWTVADAKSPTGLRLQLRDAMVPTTREGLKPSPSSYSEIDGFSAGAGLLAYLPGAVATGLPTPATIEASLSDTSPTVLIDADTGARIPHFSELDQAADPEDQSFMVRPVVRLLDGHRYIVGIRHVVDASGQAIAPSDAFRALRDRLPSDDPAVAGRRGRFGDIFRRLGKAGVARESLQLAWDFTTASLANNTAAMLSMRDQALAAVGKDGPTYTIDDLAIDPKPSIAVRIRGRFKVPMFLDKSGPGARMTLGPDGLPRALTEAEFPFVAMIPKVVANGEQVPPVWVGHGLFGSHRDIESFDDVANDGHLALLASDWNGMAGEDLVPLFNLVAGGDPGEFRTVTDRLQQSMLNALLLTRLGTGRLADDPALQFGGKSALRRDEPYYFGASQGGILGATYMALTTDVKRGVLDVPGQPYNLLLQRSEAFGPIFLSLRGVYGSMFQVQMLLQFLQMYWDRVEPSGYAAHVRKDQLPGTPQHEVLLITSIGDHLVTTLGGHIMARAIGVKNLAPLNRPVFGLESTPAPYQGSALLEIDFGLPPEPLTNVPIKTGKDPHGSLRNLPNAIDIVATFLRQGVAKGCNGPCKAEP